jgi:hypothetical protein
MKPQPRLAGVTLFGTELAQKSQIWLIGVEPHLQGATIGGEPSHHLKGYPQRPPLAGLSNSQHIRLRKRYPHRAGGGQNTEVMR